MPPTTRSTHRPPQTLAQAKADYARHGPRLSTQEARRLARGAELLRRAERLSEAEARRRCAARKRGERESRDREARARMGIGRREGPVGGSQRRLSWGVAGRMGGVEKEEEEEEAQGVENAESALLSALGERVVTPSTAVVRNDFVTARVALHDNDAVPSPSDRPCRKLARLPLPVLQSDTPAPAPALPDVSWDDFLDSSTQIARDLSSEPAATTATATASGAEIASIRASMPQPEPEWSLLDLLSTQDVSLSNEDMQELGVEALGVGVKAELARECTRGESSGGGEMMPPTLTLPIPRRSASPVADSAETAKEAPKVWNARLMPPPPPPPPPLRFSKSANNSVATSKVAPEMWPARTTPPPPPPSLPPESKPPKPPIPAGWLRPREPLAEISNRHASPVVGRGPAARPVVPAFDAADFVLSTQDCREISG